MHHYSSTIPIGVTFSLHVCEYEKGNKILSFLDDDHNPYVYTKSRNGDVKQTLTSAKHA